MAVIGHDIKYIVLYTDLHVWNLGILVLTIMAQLIHVDIDGCSNKKSGNGATLSCHRCHSAVSVITVTALSFVTTATLVCTVMLQCCHCHRCCTVVSLHHCQDTLVLLPSLSQCYLAHCCHSTVEYTAVTMLTVTTTLVTLVAIATAVTLVWTSV